MASGLLQGLPEVLYEPGPRPSATQAYMHDQKRNATSKIYVTKLQQNSFSIGKYNIILK